MQEFTECQLLLIKQLFLIENQQSGFINKALGSIEKIENILDYCKSVYEMIHNEKKVVAIQYFFIQYYVLSEQSHRLPDLRTVEHYVSAVFASVKYFPTNTKRNI